MSEEVEASVADRLVLGVDGGGSRSTAVLAVVEPSGCRELGRGDGGPANAVAPGFTAAAANLAASIDAAFAASGLARAPVAAACLGLAGAGSQQVAEQWVAWAGGRGLATRLEVMPDGLPALPDSGGLLVIAGTGSIVWGRQPDGRIERCGGRGGLMGDEGSGWAIAITGLRAVLRMADGWGDETRLLAAAVARFAVSEASELPAVLAQPATSRGEIAAFAVDVVAAANAGDRVAREIVAAAASDLGRQAIAVGRRIGVLADGYPLHVAGGVLCHASAVRTGLVAALEAAGLAPADVISEPDLAAAATRRAVAGIRGL